MTNLRDIYLVFGDGGVGTAFISALIYHWLTDNPNPMVFDSLAHCHNDYEGAWTKNYKTINMSDLQLIEKAEVLDKAVPFVGRQHMEPDFELLHKKFPNYLTFGITHDEHDRELIGCFLFFKQEVFTFNNNIDKNWNRHNIITDKNDPNELTPNEIKEFVKAVADNRVFSKQIYSEDNHVLIKFADIFSGDDTILQIISNAIEKPITQTVRDSLSNYVNANRTLVETKCPWLIFPKTTKCH